MNVLTKLRKNVTSHTQYSCKASLDYHIRIKHNEDNLHQSEMCGESFESPEDIAKHKKSHRLIEAVCKYCDQIFNTRSNLNGHMKECHSYETRLNSSKTEVLKCDQCHNAACYSCEKKVTKKNMWRHIEEVHDKTRNCPVLAANENLT